MDDALSALRGASLEPDQASLARVEIGVIRAWRLERDLTSVKWWIPVAAGAALAVVVMLAWMQFWGSPSSATEASSSPAWPAYSDTGD